MLIHGLDIMVSGASIEPVETGNAWVARSNATHSTSLAPVREALSFTTEPLGQFYGSLFRGDGDSCLTSEGWTERGRKLNTSGANYTVNVTLTAPYTLLYVAGGVRYVVTDSQAWADGAPVSNPGLVSVGSTLTINSSVTWVRWWNGAVDSGELGDSLPYVAYPYIYVEGLVSGSVHPSSTGGNADWGSESKRRWSVSLEMVL